jgi:hypothetical protein
MRSKLPPLVAGFAYYLEGIPPEKWDVGHPRFGKPHAICGRYLATVHGRREWHVFEIWIGDSEEGAIILNRQDLESISVQRLVDDL